MGDVVFQDSVDRLKNATKQYNHDYTFQHALLCQQLYNIFLEHYKIKETFIIYILNLSICFTLREVTICVRFLLY